MEMDDETGRVPELLRRCILQWDAPFFSSLFVAYFVVFFSQEGMAVGKNLRAVPVFLIVLALFLTGCGKTTSEKESEAKEAVYMRITAEEAKEIMDSTGDYILLDVREQDEFAEGHIEGAILIPYESIDARAESELPDKEQTILVYCRSGRRSAIAAQALVNLGYTDVRDFGGILDWPYETVK